MMDWSSLEKKLKELKEKKARVLVCYDTGNGSHYVSAIIKRVSSMGVTPDAHFFIPFENLVSVTCSSCGNPRIYVKKKEMPE